MKIKKYELLLEEYIPSLVKESETYYTANTEILDSPEAIVKMMNTVFFADRKAEECAWVVAFDNKMHPIGVFEISHGAVNYTIINPREVFIRLCICGAVNFALIHNHPSGDVTPSKEDYEVTKRIKECADLMAISMIDHIIIGKESIFSFRGSEKM